MDITNQFNTPVGRLVEGSPYDLVTKDLHRNVLPAEEQHYYMAIAIPKKGETHWKDTPWGANIYNTALQAYSNKIPNNFAWKIIDGDSEVVPPQSITEVPPCKREGQKGCWVIKLKSKFFAKIYTRENKVELTETGAIKLGDYVQIVVSAVVQPRAQNHSIYLNARMIFLVARGKKISSGLDPHSVKLEGELPPDAQLEIDQDDAALNKIGEYTVEPRHDYLETELKHAPKKMTDKAKHTYEEYIKAGYSDAALIQMGIMEP